MREPQFFSLSDVLLAHEVITQDHGGPQGLRDIGLLESAISQPQASFGGEYLHSYPAGMAAAYGFHLAKNHPFVDGNKRIAWAVMRQFLIREGFRLTTTDRDGVDIMLGVADGRVSKAILESWLIARLEPKSSLGAQ